MGIEGRVDKVEWMRQLGANVIAIAQGYVRAGNDEQVMIYDKQHHVDMDSVTNTIIYYYARAGNHEKVEAYRAQYNLT